MHEAQFWILVRNSEPQKRCVLIDGQDYMLNEGNNPLTKIEKYPSWRNKKWIVGTAKTNSLISGFFSKIVNYHVQRKKTQKNGLDKD